MPKDALQRLEDVRHTLVCRDLMEEVYHRDGRQTEVCRTSRTAARQPPFQVSSAFLLSFFVAYSFHPAIRIPPERSAVPLNLRQLSIAATLNRVRCTVVSLLPL